ncbi:MAG TPA: hypothetical protein VNR39_12440 [Pseudolabrys sp.]|nr:hypothetical protein [Pseudolabrys sp.]
MPKDDEEDATDLTAEQISNIRAATLAHIGTELFREKMISEMFKEGFDREAAERAFDRCFPMLEAAFAEPTSH